MGPYLPQKWLSGNWNEIHEAFIVDIREVKDDKRIERNRDTEATLVKKSHVLTGYLSVRAQIQVIYRPSRKYS